MAKKGKEKNTQNKAKHTKLMQRKKNKERKNKEESAARLKVLVEKIKLEQAKEVGGHE